MRAASMGDGFCEYAGRAISDTKRTNKQVLIQFQRTVERGRLSRPFVLAVGEIIGVVPPGRFISPLEQEPFGNTVWQIVAGLFDRCESEAKFYNRGFECAIIRGIMRRLLSTLLLAVIASGSLAPLAIARGDSTPLCCRRDGKHHCQMGLQIRDDGRDGAAHLRGPASDCPYRYQVGPTTLSATISPPTNTSFSPVVGENLPVDDFCADSNVSFRFGLFRGPPFLLL